MPVTPIRLNIYNPETDEIERELVRTFIPWRILKRSIQMYREIGGKEVEGFEEADIDKLAGLVVDVFGADKITIAELDEKCDIGDMMATISQIVSSAAGLSPSNPTKQA